MRAPRVVPIVMALFACACSSASKVETRFDDGRIASEGAHVRGMRNGPWTDYYQSGAKKCAGSYENDAQTGLWTWWFENGNKEMEGAFSSEQRDGEWTSWHENGALRARGRFERGYEEGPWRFYDRDGALDHAGCFELGKPVLRWTWFNSDGSQRESGNYLAGVKVGAWSAQDAAGNRTETVYPLPNGCELCEERFADSTPRRAGFVRDGAPSGRWHTFHPGGALRLECDFERGEPNGNARAWRDDGSLLARGNLRDGRVSGAWTFKRGETEETLEPSADRPAPTFTGEWSSAQSADMHGWMCVETWIAEMRSPRQPAPIQATFTPAPLASAPPPATTELAGIPARAQPWTEYERDALPGLVELYSGGASGARDAEAWNVHGWRRSNPIRAAGVAHAADLVGHALPRTLFTTSDGDTIDLAAFVGKRNVLLTILRGFGGQVCVYCAAQTRALAERAADFAALDTEVVVVLPGPASGVGPFLEAYRRTFGADEKPPYKLLYDVDLSLTRALRIEDNFAVPTSILLDRDGIVRWSHVAKDHADRPSVQTVLEAIRALPKRAR